MQKGASLGTRNKAMELEYRGHFTTLKGLWKEKVMLVNMCDLENYRANWMLVDTSAFSAVKTFAGRRGTPSHWTTFSGPRSPCQSWPHWLTGFWFFPEYSPFWVFAITPTASRGWWIDGDLGAKLLKAPRLMATDVVKSNLIVGVASMYVWASFSLLRVRISLCHNW